MGQYFQSDCSWEQAPLDPGSQPTLQESPGRIQKEEAPPMPAPVGNGGDRVPAALERKSSWTDQKKAMQSDESPHPRTSTPSTGPLLHSCSPRPHPTSTKPANSILCGSCIHIHITFPGPPVSIPRGVSSFRVTKRSSPVKGVLYPSSEAPAASSGQPQRHFPATNIAHHHYQQPYPGILSLQELIYLFTSPNPFPAAQAGTWAHTH